MSHDEAARYARICDLTAAYAVLVDGRRAEEWAHLFTEDGVLTFDGKRVEGRTALIEFAAGSPPGIHLGAPPTVTEDEHGITARSQFFFRPADGARLLAGSYTDRVVDDGTVARFASRSIEILSAARTGAAG